MNILSKRFSNLSVLFHLVSSQYHLDIFAKDDVSTLPPRSLTEKSETMNQRHDVKILWEWLVPWILKIGQKSLHAIPWELPWKEEKPGTSCHCSPTHTVTHLCSYFLCSPCSPFFRFFSPDAPSVSVRSYILQWIFLTNLNSNLHASSWHRGFQNKNWNRKEFFSSSAWAAFFSLQWVPRIWIPNCGFQDHLVSWWKERQYTVERLRVYRERKCRKSKQKRRKLGQKNKNTWKWYTGNMFLKRKLWKRR